MAVLWISPGAFPVLSLITEGDPGSVLPAGTPNIVAYAIGWGPLGLIALALGWLFYKEWRLTSPKREAAMKKAAREEGRADLLDQIKRLLEENQELRSENRAIAAQRDDALKVARDQLMPLLVNFTAATQSLLPVLQALVSQGMWPRQRGQGGTGP